MYFSDQEKVAIVQMLRLMTFADHDITEEEMKIVNTVEYYLKPSSAAMATINRLKGETLVNRIVEMSTEKRKFLSALMMWVIVGDEQYTTEERALYDNMKDLCQLPDVSSEEIKNAMREVFTALQ